MTRLPCPLDRYHTAQNNGSPSAFQQALAELRAGRKDSHWIWFVLPQLRELGRSPNARRYGIADLAEARAYRADPILRERLEIDIRLITEQLQRPGQSLPALMGGDLDAAKTISSLTLFEAAGLPAATALLDRLGQRCPLTRRILGQASEGDDVP